MSLRFSRLLVMILPGLLLFGCPKMVDDLVAQATSPENQARYAAALANPEVQKAVADLMANATSGALDGYTDAERQAALRGATTELVGALSTQIASDLDTKLAPVLQEEIVNTLSAGIARALSPSVRRDSAKFAAEVTAAAVEAFTGAASRDFALALRNDLGPAFQQVIEQNLTVAFDSALKTEKEPAADFVRAVSEAAADGLGKSLQKGGALGAALDERDAAFRQDVREARNLALTFGGVSACLLGLVALLIFRAHRLQLVTNDKDDLVMRLSTAVRDIGDTPEGRYVAARMRQKNDTRSGRLYKKMLAENPQIRFDPGPDDPARLHEQIVRGR